MKLLTFQLVVLLFLYFNFVNSEPHEFPIFKGDMESHSRRREVARNTEFLVLEGGIASVSVFYTRLVIGTPGKTYPMIVDTGM